ncbi:MAG: sensor histidine kinase [Actinomycetes bacterium]
MVLMDRLGRAGPKRAVAWTDVLVAIVVGVIAVGSVLTQDIASYMVDPNAFSVAMVVGASGAVAFRRRYPIGALVAGTVLLAIPVLFAFPEGVTPFIFYILIGSMAARCELNRAVVGLVFSAFVIAVLSVWAPGFDLFSATVTLAIVILVWIMGAGIRWRLESAQDDVRAAEQRAETERLRGERAVAEERLRIAQELHDVVAHSMSVIAVQAGMGSHVLKDDPAKAQGALDAISDISRSTLTEMRRLLSILRSVDGNDEHVPAPSVADLPALIDELRAAGLPVVLDIQGEPSMRHSGIELSAYRLVQESLTNVMKHAGHPSKVNVFVRYRGDELTIKIEDDGRGLASAKGSVGIRADGSEAPGHGLMGMRERVAVWGGQLSTGPRPGGGYVVSATFPYGEPR